MQTLFNTVSSMQPFSDEWTILKSTLSREKELIELSLVKLNKDQCTLDDIYRATDPSYDEIVSALSTMDLLEADIERYYRFRL